MSKGTIVLVENADEVREILEIMLRHEGYTVYSFSEHRDVLSMARNFVIDLFLIDMVQRPCEGIALLEDLKIKENLYEAIMVVGKNEVESAYIAVKLGAFGYLTKPFSFEELKTMVESALERAISKKQPVIPVAVKNISV